MNYSPYPKNITSEEDEAAILHSVDRFLERDVRPYARDLEADDEYPREISRCSRMKLVVVLPLVPVMARSLILLPGSPKYRWQIRG